MRGGGTPPLAVVPIRMQLEIARMDLHCRRKGDCGGIIVVFGGGGGRRQRRRRRRRRRPSSSYRERNDQDLLPDPVALGRRDRCHRCVRLRPVRHGEGHFLLSTSGGRRVREGGRR